MPIIPVNLGDVTSSFEDLPTGEYYGEIEKMVFMDAREQGKYPQIRCQYMVIDGDHINRRQSQFLSLSPKAMGFTKDFFAKFGLGNTENFDVDDETNDLNDPDVVGSKVYFKVGPDRKDATRIRTELVSVEEPGPGVPDFEAEPAPVAPARAAAPIRPAARRAAAPAPAPEPEAEVEAEEEPEEEVEAPAPAPAPRAVRAAVAPRPAARPAPAAAPVRRTLR